MTGQFEIHITCLDAQRGLAAMVAKELHWKTSAIAGDPQLGDDTFFYLTSYADNLDAALGRLDRCMICLWEEGVRPLREKIEQIVHDVRHPG